MADHHRGAGEELAQGSCRTNPSFLEEIVERELKKTGLEAR